MKGPKYPFLFFFFLFLSFYFSLFYPFSLYLITFVHPAAHLIRDSFASHSHLVRTGSPPPLLIALPPAPHLVRTKLASPAKSPLALLCPIPLPGRRISSVSPAPALAPPASRWHPMPRLSAAALSRSSARLCPEEQR